MQTSTQRRAAFRSAQASYDNASPPDNDAACEWLDEIESEELNRLLLDDGEIADSLGTVEFTSEALLALVASDSTTRQLLSAAYSIRAALVADFERRATEQAPRLLREAQDSVY